jgi:tRNA(fMet)-specific endonuclease VapC
MRYLLDTNIISDLIKHPEGAAAGRVRSLKADELWTSIIVSAELKFGYVRKRSKRLEDLIEKVLASFQVAAWDAPSDMAYAQLRTKLEDSGRPISQNDMLIAAHAVALDAVLVTDNEREFARVSNLRVENWLRP